MKATIIITTLALGLALAGTASAVPATQVFVSPTRNIVCVYANQYGIGCRAMNNGSTAILHAYSGAVTFDGYVRVQNRYAAPVIRYGRTATYGGTFHVRSTRAGFDVWSSLSGRGFHIDRDGAWNS